MNRAVPWLVAIGVAACGTTKVAPTSMAQTPAPKNRAAELAARADHMLAATYHLDYTLPMKAHVAPDVVRVRYFEACRAGDHRACWMVRSAQQHGSRVPADVYDNEAQELVRRNCRVGDQMSCRAVIRELDAPEDDLPGHVGRSEACTTSHGCNVAALMRECDAGFGASCFDLVLQDVPGRSDKDSAMLAVPHLREGCRVGLAEECSGLRALLIDFPAPAYAADRLFADEQTCPLDLSGCSDLSTLLRQSDPNKARDAVERVCQQEDPLYGVYACKDLWQAYVDHQLPEPFPGRAAQLRDWACKVHEACW